MSGSDELDGVVEAVVREAPHRAAPGEDCPNPNDIAGLVDDRLLAEERAELERHLARCDRCRAVVASAEPEEAEAARLSPLRPYLAAAAVLAVVSLASWIGWMLLGGGLDTDARLVASAERLADTRPDLFAGFFPLDRSERLAPPPVARGDSGPVLLHPAGRILARRPDFAWEGTPGAQGYSVELMRADGTPLWRIETPDEGNAYPEAEVELEPGAKYLWTVTASGVLGESSESRVFSVATVEKRKGFEEALAEIRARSEPSIAELLAAHFATRNELYAEAEEAARRAWTSDPDDAACAETLAHVLRILGASEAERIEER